MKTIRTLVYAALFSMLSGCFFFGPPFEANARFASVPQDKPVIVGVTHVTLGSNSKSNKAFWDHTYQVVESLPDHHGYLGHRVRKKLFINEAWTMTVWEDEDALNKFVRGSQHGKAMANGLAAVKKARFVRFALPRSETPIDWKTTEQFMKTKGRNLY